MHSVEHIFEIPAHESCRSYSVNPADMVLNSTPVLPQSGSHMLILWVDLVAPAARNEFLWDEVFLASLWN